MDSNDVLWDSEFNINHLQVIYDIDANSQVYLQGRIGAGFYGEVFKGTLDTKDGDQREVAIKRLKPTAMAKYSDFEREIRIMKVSNQLSTIS